MSSQFCRDHVKWARETDDFGPQERLSCFVGDEGTWSYCVMNNEPLRRVPVPMHRDAMLICLEYDQSIADCICVRAPTI